MWMPVICSRTGQLTKLFYRADDVAYESNGFVPIYRRIRTGEMKRLKWFVYNPQTGKFGRSAQRPRLVMRWVIA